MGERAYIGPIVLFVLARLGVLGGGVTVSVILGAVAVAWFGSVEAIQRREAEAERQRATYRAAKEREAAREPRAADDALISLRCDYSPSGMERQGPKAMLRAVGHVDPGCVPETARTRVAPERLGRRREPELPGAVATDDWTAHDWLCRYHGLAVIKTSPSGRKYVGCPSCHSFARPGDQTHPPEALETDPTATLRHLADAIYAARRRRWEPPSGLRPPG